MKKIILAYFLVLATSSLFAQKTNVKIKFTGATENKVFVQLPLDGTTFYPNRQEKIFDADSNLLISLPVEKIANLYISNSGKRFRFLIEPGDVSIKLNVAKKASDRIVFDGTNAVGQVALNSKPNIFYQTRASKYLTADSTVTGVMKLLETDRNKEFQVFDDLLTQKKISKTFYEEVKGDIKMDYIATTAAMPIQLFFDSQRPNSKVVFKQEFKDLWKKIYDEHPFNDLADLTTTEYYYHAQYYSDYYVGMYLKQVNGTWEKPDFNDPNARLKISYEGFGKNFTGKTREYLMASFLFNEIFQKKYQPILVELLNDFETQYPKSKFSPLLRPAADEIVAYHETSKKQFANDQKFVPNYQQINTLDDLMSQFKGKTVFVDLWATWCGPCKAEFEYGEELDKFLKAKGAEMLYISMDKNEADQQWKDMIKFYKLSGNHIRVNPTLLQNLMDKLWDGKGYSIPRYLILKNGKLVNDKALRPSDKKLLYDQISAHL